MLNEQGTSERLDIAPSMVRLQSCPTTPRVHRDKSFSCAICTDSVVDPVLTQCGHLFCWPCLYLWLEPGMTLDERALLCCEALPQDAEIVPNVNNRTCPSCKTPCSIQLITPVYVAVEERSTLSPMNYEANGQLYLDTDDDLTLSDSSSQSFDSVASQSTGSLSIPHRPSPMSIVSTCHDEELTSPSRRPVTEQSCSLSSAIFSLIQIPTTLWLDRHNTCVSRASVPLGAHQGSFSSIQSEWGQRYNPDSDKQLNIYLFSVTAFALAIIVCVNPS